MKRIGFLLKVKQEKLDAYTKHHETVWPEMLDALRRTGWHNYSILRPRGRPALRLLRGGYSFEGSLAGMAKEEINARWQEFMAPYFENLSGAHADESMVELMEVFHTD